jgi:ribosome-binding protein aMBF1 (putative translation factor)
MRMTGRDGIARAVYAAVQDRRLLVLHVFVKKTQTAARMRAGLTQSQIAQRMGTTQSVIARLEGGQRTPSISTVQRYALAAGCKAVFRLEPLSS